jgi:putative membrane protein
MKQLIVIFFAAILCSCNDNENGSNKAAKDENKAKFDSTDMKRDATFAVTAASGGMMEVALGNIAMTNGASQLVKDFGHTMVADHSKAGDELMSVAASRNITLPSVPNSHMQKKIDDLKQKRGTDFDKAYIDLMVDDHKEDINDFQKEVDKGNDPDVQRWAAGKIPTLQHHLQMASDIQKAMKE